MKNMQDINLKDKRVLIREDFNVPLSAQGNISSDARIKAALPTIKQALDQGAAVILMSHLGRPAEGKFTAAYSLAVVADCLTQQLKQNVRLVKDWQQGVTIKSGEVILLENVRFNTGEQADEPGVSKQLASLCDVFVMDAFATAHRAQASTHGVAKYAPVVCAGPLLQAELSALSKVIKAPVKPFVAIVGGAKVSTKLPVLENLLNKVEQLIVGGGIANTFIAAAGYNVGRSLYEADLIPTARALIKAAKARGAEIPMPLDVITATECSAMAKAMTKPITAVDDNEMILDIGPQTTQLYAKLLKKAKTIVWNGPVGVFELPPFAQGTKALALAIADSAAFTVAGGGDTLAAIDQYQLNDKISYISTGGGAFLELLEGKVLPAVAILEEKG